MTIAMERCDWETLQTLAAGQAQVARDMGALVQLRSALMGLAAAYIMQGDLGAAARLVEEDRLLAEVTGTPPVATTPQCCLRRGGAGSKRRARGLGLACGCVFG